MALLWRLIMYCRTAIAKIMVGMKGLLVRVAYEEHQMLNRGPKKIEGAQVDHYVWPEHRLCKAQHGLNLAPTSQT